MSHSILIVDDEPLTRVLFRLMLEPAGFQIFEAEDGIDALEKIKQNRPDVLLLDIMMPRMDGYTVCKKLRGNEETADLPIIMCSARSDQTALNKSIDAGANRYLLKPVPRQDLLQNINESLRDATSPSA